jgi:DNA repair protein RadD
VKANKTTAWQIKLRNYQRAAIRGIKASWKSGHRCVLLIMPPNAGKTVVFEHVVAEALKKGERVCVVAPNVVLTRQTIDKMTHLNPGIIWAGHPPDYDNQLQVASAMTLAKRLDRYSFDLVVVDEAHHCAAETWVKILEHYDSARVLGVTATAKRLDGKGLDICGFTDIVRGPWVDKLTPEFMAPYRLWAPNVPALLEAPEGTDYKPSDLEKHGIEMGVLIGDAVKHYEKHTKGKRALAFCMSIKDSKETVDKFRKAGFRAEHMDGDTPHEERQRMLSDLNARRLDIISSCNVLGEGLDITGVEVVIQLRSTRSYQIYIQQIGRGLRQDPADSEKVLDVIDCAGNYFRLWSPSVDRMYGLDGKADVDADTEAREAARKHCATCGLVYYSEGRGYCPECLTRAPEAVKTEKEARAVWRDGELVRVGEYGPLYGLYENKNRNSSSYTVCVFFKNKRVVISLGCDKDIAQKQLDIANKKITDNGGLPDSIEVLRAWLGRGSKFDRGKISIRTEPYGYSISKRIGTKNVWVWLGKDKKKAQKIVDSVNQKWIENKYQWPETEKEFRSLFGHIKTLRNSLLKLGSNKVVSRVINGKKCNIYLGNDESVIKAKIDNANNIFTENNFVLPDSEDTFREWLLSPRKTKEWTPIKVHKCKRGYYTQCKKIKIDIGNDFQYAKYCVDRANKISSENRGEWPDNSRVFREWLGYQHINKRKPLKFHIRHQAESNTDLFIVSKNFDKIQYCISLGTDRAKAQAAVDRANAKWEANGHKWPDTEAELREWLGRPPTPDLTKRKR